MDFAKIQKLVLEHGDKFVILQDGEPAMVVMSFSDYERLAGLPRGRNGAAPQTPHEETLALPSRQDEWQTSRRDEWQMPDAPETEFIADDPAPTPLRRARLDEIRLEDLPL